MLVLLSHAHGAAEGSKGREWWGSWKPWETVGQAWSFSDCHEMPLWLLVGGLAPTALSLNFPFCEGGVSKETALISNHVPSDGRVC